MFLMAARVAPAADFPHQIVTSGLGYFPVAVRLRNGDVLAVIRGGAAHIGVKGRLDLVRSTDGGKTWSPPWTAIDGSLDDRNPSIGQLKVGRILMVYGERNAPRGAHAMISPDGRTWDKSKRIVLADDAPNGDCGYPSSVEVGSGKVVTLYYQVDDPKNAPASSSARAILWSVPKK